VVSRITTLLSRLQTCHSSFSTPRSQEHHDNKFFDLHEWYQKKDLPHYTVEIDSSIHFPHRSTGILLDWSMDRTKARAGTHRNNSKMKKKKKIKHIVLNELDATRQPAC